MIKANVTISCFYVPPNSSNEYHELVLSALRFLWAKPHQIITGDFNLPDINWYTLSASSPFSISFSDLTFTLNLQQLICTSTHTHGNTLDIVLTDSLELVSNIVVDPHSCLDLSDHYLNSITTTIHKRPIVSSPRCRIFHYSKVNLEGLLSFLDGFNMDITSDNVNYMWNTMKGKGCLYSLFPI